MFAPVKNYSTIVDEDSELKVVYHGTSNTFDSHREKSNFVHVNTKSSDLSRQTGVQFPVGVTNQNSLNNSIKRERDVVKARQTSGNILYLVHRAPFVHVSKSFSLKNASFHEFAFVHLEMFYLTSSPPLSEGFCPPDNGGRERGVKTNDTGAFAARYLNVGCKITKK